jgi:predicted GNAT family N-acyltransferase
MVVGCATLLPEGEGRAKLMQMAVHPQRQGEGIGRKLVAEIERRALGELGVQELYCHAQESACGFYEQLGWQYDSDVFEEVGVRHRRMVVRAANPAEDDFLVQ